MALEAIQVIRLLYCHKLLNTLMTLVKEAAQQSQKVCYLPIAAIERPVTRRLSKLFHLEQT